MDTDLYLMQAWCQAPEHEQAAGIKIVAASMEAAQDVSRTSHLSSPHLKLNAAGLLRAKRMALSCVCLTAEILQLGRNPVVRRCLLEICCPLRTLWELYCSGSDQRGAHAGEVPGSAHAGRLQRGQVPAGPGLRKLRHRLSVCVLRRPEQFGGRAELAGGGHAARPLGRLSRHD